MRANSNNVTLVATSSSSSNGSVRLTRVTLELSPVVKSAVVLGDCAAMVTWTGSNGRRGGMAVVATTDDARGLRGAAEAGALAVAAAGAASVTGASANASSMQLLLQLMTRAPPIAPRGSLYAVAEAPLLRILPLLLLELLLPVRAPLPLPPRLSLLLLVLAAVPLVALPPGQLQLQHGQQTTVSLFALGLGHRSERGSGHGRLSQ